jgi:predicted secreted protein
MQTYHITVIGMVERTVTVEAENLESAKSTAEGEWAALTGGVIETTETVSAVEVE